MASRPKTGSEIGIARKGAKTQRKAAVSVQRSESKEHAGTTFTGLSPGRYCDTLGGRLGMIVQGEVMISLGTSFGADQFGRIMFKEWYFWIYWCLLKVKTNDTPAFNSLIIITILQELNILSILMIINQYFILIESNQWLYIVLVLYTMLSGLNYVYLYSKKETFIKIYEHQSIKRKAVGKVALVVYVILSITSYLIIATNVYPYKA